MQEGILIIGSDLFLELTCFGKYQHICMFVFDFIFSQKLTKKNESEPFNFGYECTLM